MVMTAHLSLNNSYLLLLYDPIGGPKHAIMVCEENAINCGFDILFRAIFVVSL